MSYETAARCLAAWSLLAGASSVAAQHTGALKSVRDDARERVYVLLQDGVDALDAATGRKLARIALGGWTWVGVPYSCPPDMALSPEGDILVTSNIVPIIWRIDRRSFAATMHALSLDEDRGRDVGFIRLRWSRKLQAFVATTPLGETWHIDRPLFKAWKISNAREPQAASACAG